VCLFTYLFIIEPMTFYIFLWSNFRAFILKSTARPTCTSAFTHAHAHYVHFLLSLFVVFVHIHVAWNYSIVYVCSHLVTWCLLSFCPPFFAPHTCLPSSVMLKAEVLLSRKCLITGEIHLWYATFIINYWCVTLIRGADDRGAI